MANINKPFGLRPVRHFSGAPWNGATELYSIPAGDGTAVFVGDIVKPGSSSDAAGIPDCIQAAAGDTLLLGVVVGIVPDYSNLGLLNRAVSTLRYVQVCTDPTTVYQVQANSTVLVTDVGLNGDIDVAAGNTVTGLSGMTLDTDGTPALGTGTAQLRILGVSQIPGNDLGLYTVCDVLINEHAMKSTTGV